MRTDVLCSGSHVRVCACVCLGAHTHVHSYARLPFCALTSPSPPVM